MPAAIPIAIGVVAASSAYGAYQSNRQAKAAQSAADRQNAMQEQQLATAKAKRTASAPSQAGYYSGTALSGGPSSGLGSTMLTGSQGVDPNALQIGKRTLLG